MPFCPPRRRMSAFVYCLCFPGCPGCRNSISRGLAGATPVGPTPTQFPPDPSAEGLLDLFQGDALGAFRVKLPEIEKDLPADPTQRNLALAKICGERGLPLEQARFLAQVLQATDGDPAIALDLADALRAAGDALKAAGIHREAIEMYQRVPEFAAQAGDRGTALVVRALRGQAQSLRAQEPDAVWLETLAGFIEGTGSPVGG